jgi:hypothetical protein
MTVANRYALVHLSIDDPRIERTAPGSRSIRVLIFMNIAGSQILLGVCIRRDTRHDAFKGTVNSRNYNTQYPQFAEMNPPWHPLESV